jgi:fibro-slime domain-containing protein
MRFIPGFVTIAAAVLTASAVSAAPALPITGQLQADWFTVQAGGSGDFQTYCCSDFRSDMVLGTLGPNGLPVYNTASVGPQALTGIDSLTGEIQWWTPGVTNGGDTVTSTGTTLVNFPFTDTSMFPTNGGGTRNGGQNGFQTAKLFTNLQLGERSLVTWNMSADDDAWVFIGGKLVTGLGGVHPVTASPVGQILLDAGQHDIIVFFADRHTTASSLSFSATAAAVVPEPATWAMLIAGFGLVGMAARRRGRVAA